MTELEILVAIHETIVILGGCIMLSLGIGLGFFITT